MSKKYFRFSSNHACERHVMNAPPSIRKEYLDNDNYLPALTDDANACTRCAYQKATVDVPVAVRPLSFAGTAKTYCCREPVFEDIVGKDKCNDEIGCFAIKREICVGIPVHFGAKVSVGESWIKCGENSTEDGDDDGIPDEGNE